MTRSVSVTRRIGIGLLAGMALVGTAMAAGDGHSVHIEKQSWPFSGITGQFNQAQLQRGFQVYKEVCASCHSISRVAFRELTGPGGPNFPEAQVKKLASEYEVDGEPDDSGEVQKRPARLSDTFPKLYKNDQEARSIHNGAVPPDLSLITSARGIPHANNVFTHVLTMGKEIFTGYQEGGADYTFALLTGYREEAPKGVTVQDGLYYNVAFAGNQIAMAPPFAAGDGQVEYQDGTPNTVENYAKDVTAFLYWAANPHHDTRKRTGWLALLYLLVTSVLLYLAYKATWRGMKH